MNFWTKFIGRTSYLIIKINYNVKKNFSCISLSIVLFCL